jgi:hypothetical protein
VAIALACLAFTTCSSCFAMATSEAQQSVGAVHNERLAEGAQFPPALKREGALIVHSILYLGRRPWYVFVGDRELRRRRAKNLRRHPIETRWRTPETNYLRRRPPTASGKLYIYLRGWEI